MAADIDYIVNAPHRPEIPVLIAASAVACEVATFDVAPILLYEPFRIAVDSPQHRGPGARDDQIAALVRPDGDAFFGTNVRDNAREGKRRRSGLGRDRSRNGRDQDRPGLRLPPRVDDRATTLADDSVIPHPCFRVGI